MIKLILTYCFWIIFGLTLIIDPTGQNDDRKKNYAEDITGKRNFVVGESIKVRFKVDEKSEYKLLVKGSYGNTVLNRDNNPSGDVVFTIPPFISERKGRVDYVLTLKNDVISQGSFYIHASSQSAHPLETYLGPTSIIAGKKDYGMVVVIPTDNFDNPLKDSTEVQIKHQFLAKKTIEELLTNDFLAWKNIYSYNKSGRMLVSAETIKASSKEFTLDIFPSQAQNFMLFSNSQHEFADGNQIVEFYTSQIKDTFGNIVSDSRIVDFIIKTDKNKQLKTSGATVDGVARAFIVHPDHSSTWAIKAYITGMAESDSITLDFKPAVNNFSVEFSENNRMIRVGPIYSFMNQILPDGALIHLTLFKENKLLETITKYSYEGEAVFSISKDFYSSGEYQIKIESMGVVKEYDITFLE